MNSNLLILLLATPLFLFSKCKQTEEIQNESFDLPLAKLEEISHQKPLQKISKNFSLAYTSTCFSDLEAQKYLDELEDIKNFIENTLKLKPKKLAIPVRVYESIEEKGMKIGSTLPAEIMEQDLSLHTVSGKYIDGRMLAESYRLILRKYLGKSIQPWIEEGLIFYLKNTKEQISWDHWANKLSAAKVQIESKNLINEKDFQKESIWLRQIQSYLMIKHIIDAEGIDGLSRNYHKNLYAIEELDLISMESLKKYDVALKQKSKKDFPYLKGFNFAHEGYQMYNGYGSNLAKQSLSRLKHLGTNAIAIVPYSYMRDDQKATPIPIVTRSGTETDEGLIVSQSHAQELGMFCLLKPQIWLGRSWPGSIEMQSDEEWIAFFNHYKKWIMHFALLAELHEFDAFCIGVEFAKASIAKPEKWRSLIKDIKAIYSGPITYAANWGEEFENLTFWDDVDFIGLNCYYPLHSSDQTTKNQMVKEISKTAKKVAEISKKIR